MSQELPWIQQWLCVKCTIMAFIPGQFSPGRVLDHLNGPHATTNSTSFSKFVVWGMCWRARKCAKEKSNFMALLFITHSYSATLWSCWITDPAWSHDWWSKVAWLALTHVHEHHFLQEPSSSQQLSSNEKLCCAYTTLDRSAIFYMSCTVCRMHHQDQYWFVWCWWFNGDTKVRSNVQIKRWEHTTQFSAWNNLLHYYNRSFIALTCRLYKICVDVCKL